MVKFYKGPKKVHAFVKSIKMEDGSRLSEYRCIAQKALGKKLPKNCVIHHINCDYTDHRNHNLVMCPSQAYHCLLHKRTKELIQKRKRKRKRR